MAIHEAVVAGASAAARGERHGIAALQMVRAAGGVAYNRCQQAGVWHAVGAFTAHPAGVARLRRCSRATPPVPRLICPR